MITLQRLWFAKSNRMAWSLALPRTWETGAQKVTVPPRGFGGGEGGTGKEQTTEGNLQDDSVSDDVIRYAGRRFGCYGRG